MGTTTHWHKGVPLTEGEFQALQAEKAARRPADATDRCLLVRGGGSFCMRQLPLPPRWILWLTGVAWEGAQIHRGGGGLYCRVTCEQRSNLAGTRGSVALHVSFDPGDECGERVYFRRYRGLMPEGLLPAWVADPIGNLQRHGADVSKWGV